MFCLYPEGDGEGLLEFVLFFIFLLNYGGNVAMFFVLRKGFNAFLRCFCVHFSCVLFFSTIIIISIIIIITTIYWLTNR